MEDPDLTLHGAKAIAQEGERDIVALIPDDLIVSVDQRPTGSLMSCTGERNYQWSGGTTVTLVGGTNRRLIIDEVVSAYERMDGWSTRDTSDAAGYAQVTIQRPLSGGYLLSAWNDSADINVYSFSPCFHLPDDMTPHGSY
ncbi:MAG: hypothetical protein P0Y48_06855 [Candidatus Microbacterium phytovorans]|uniref:Uncharacterized protein n=1 Tax=Candidatus Microbacterium phytovorans TaxID=3121374 RepID=A0AAJ5W462_9MICO|nr:hypothetical protein [Microbacterium sp.]WEK14903.1 MAG: hypothetical protein P0Y48_06855 [Microbacterium sp.]